MQIVYFQFKDFHVPFMTLQGIGFKFFANIIRGSYVFCCSSCISFNPTSHFKLLPVPVDLSKLSDAAKNDVVKKYVYNVKIKNIEDKTPDITN